MSSSVGQKLRRTRQERGLTLEQVAFSTCIRLHYLQAMEAGDFSSLPSPVQARGFLRAYAGHLGLEVEPLLDALKIGLLPTPTSPPEETVQRTRGADSQEEGTETIFSEIGQSLRTQRETLGLSLEVVEHHTHLRVHYLEALEKGAWEDLPSPVQGRGMLKNYANFLGMDPEPILLRFAEGLQARLTRKQPLRPVERTFSMAPIRKRGGISRDVLLGGAIILFLAVFVSWGVLRIAEMRASQEIIPTPPSIAEVLLPSPSPTLAATPTPTVPPLVDEPEVEEGEGSEGVEPTLEPTLSIIGEGDIQVQFIIRQRAWVRVRVDGEIEFEGRVIPGSTQAYAGDEQIEILTGNGAALQIFYNQLDQGVMGQFGEVVHRVYTPDGVLLPTPTEAPTEVSP